MNRSTRCASVILLLVGSATLSCSAQAGPARTADGPRPGEAWVLYQGVNGRATDARMVRADGTGDHAVLPQPGTFQTNPDWSPDGERVTLIIRHGSTDDLWVVNADGTRARKLVDCTAHCNYLDDPAWSPDGSQVVYARTEHDGARNSLETVDVRTGRIHVLRGPSTHTFFAGPRWSPRGSAVVCEVVHKRGRGIDDGITGVVLSIVDVDTRTTLGLTDPRLFAATADWSPDGSTLVYSALPVRGAEAPDLFTIRPDRTGRHRITTVADHGGYAAEPTFTPDGRTVVFSGQVGSASESDQLLRVSTLGGDVSSFHGLAGRHPRWRPATESPS